MLRAQISFAQLQRAPKALFGLLVVAALKVMRAKRAGRVRNGRVIGTQSLFADRQRPQVQRLGLLELALPVESLSEAVEHGAGLPVLRTNLFFRNCERPAE